MAWNPLDRLSDEQQEKLRELGVLLVELNRNINLISREDEDAVFKHHILHCLSLTHKAFPAGSVVVDWGTGGGLPALPLAVAFPDVLFIGVDAVGKKTQAVRAMARRLGLDNVISWHGRAESFDGRADYSVSRATAPLGELWSWHERVATSTVDKGEPGLWEPSLTCLKGGDLTEEVGSLPQNVRVEEIRLASLFDDAYFAEKVILQCAVDRAL